MNSIQSERHTSSAELTPFELEKDFFFIHFREDKVSIIFFLLVSFGWGFPVVRHIKNRHWSKAVQIYQVDNFIHDAEAVNYIFFLFTLNTQYINISFFINLPFFANKGNQNL